MIALRTSCVNRWSAVDGGLSYGTASVTVSCGTVEVTATVADGVASVSAADAAKLMPEIGIYIIDWGGVTVSVERVSGRYATYDDLIEYSEVNNDDFGRLPDSRICDAIQTAEETIESGTGRSFTTRSVQVAIPSGVDIVELPVVDVQALSDTALTLITDRQCSAPETSETVTVTYGSSCDSSIHRACLQLSAWYLRPRVGAENARGTTQEGVYVSYELATGTDGSWTGLPAVDACIESHRCRRLVVM